MATILTFHTDKEIQAAIKNPDLLMVGGQTTGLKRDGTYKVVGEFVYAPGKEPTISVVEEAIPAMETLVKPIEMVVKPATKVKRKQKIEEKVNE